VARDHDLAVRTGPQAQGDQAQGRCIVGRRAGGGEGEADCLARLQLAWAEFLAERGDRVVGVAPLRAGVDQQGHEGVAAADLDLLGDGGGGLLEIQAGDQGRGNGAAGGCQELAFQVDQGRRRGPGRGHFVPNGTARQQTCGGDHREGKDLGGGLENADRAGLVRHQDIAAPLGTVHARTAGHLRRRVRIHCFSLTPNMENGG
jgi:hypothetical protein